MATQVEQVVNRRMDVQKALSLVHRFESGMETDGVLNDFGRETVMLVDT
jgi:hypothetical protein